MNFSLLTKEIQALLAHHERLICKYEIESWSSDIRAITFFPSFQFVLFCAQIEHLLLVHLTKIVCTFIYEPQRVQQIQTERHKRPARATNRNKKKKKQIRNNDTLTRWYGSFSSSHSLNLHLNSYKMLLVRLVFRYSVNYMYIFCLVRAHFSFYFSNLALVAAVHSCAGRNSYALFMFMFSLISIFVSLLVQASLL